MARTDSGVTGGLVAILALATACGPSAQDGRVQAMTLVLTAQGYEPRQVELKYLQDPVALKGEVATLLGGARVVVDPNDPLLSTNNGNLTEAQLEAIFMKSTGIEPRASYIDKGGILWPADFHTWNMVTTYYNFQKSFEYWQGIYSGAGLTDLSELKGSKVLYFPAFTITEASPSPQTDNALFFPPVQAFAILPFERLQTVPLSINQGVVAHEFAHRVFNRRVYGGRSLPEPLVRWIGIGASTPGVNLLKAMDEGLADFHAYGVTCASELGCNPRFLQASLGEAATDERDLSKPDKCMTTALSTAMTTLSVGDFTRQGLEYKIGTLLAASLYQAGSKSGRVDELQRAVLSAYSDLGTERGFAELISQNLDTPDNFKLHVVADTILAHIPNDDLRKQTCNEFLDRLQLQNACAVPKSADCFLPHCPASSAPGNTCDPTK